MNPSNRTPHFSIKDLTVTAIFAALLAIGSWLAIPAPIPFTLQTLAVFLTVGLLGGRRGSLAVGIYLLLGLFGVPVFANFTGGIAVFLGERGGYLSGLLAAALLMWGMERLCGRSTPALAAAMVAGLLLCYTVGTLWFVAIHARAGRSVGVWASLTLCVLPYVLPDMAKIGLALYICRRVRRGRHFPL